MINSFNTLEKPIEIKKTFNIAAFNYSIIDVILFQSATIILRFLDEFGIIQKQTEYKVIGEEYDNWKDDDQYIIDLIVSKIPDLIK